MLLGYFKKNAPAAPILLVFAGLMLWSDVFLFFSKQIPPKSYSEPLFSWLFGLVNLWPFLYVLLPFLLVLTQAFIINFIVQASNLLEKPSWLPGFLYVLLMSSNQDMLKLNPALVANLFLLFAIARAMSLYGEGEVMLKVFNVGVLLAIAGLFYYPALMFFLWLIMVLALYYLLSLRGLIAAAMGFVTPFFFLFTWYFLSDQHFERIQDLPKPDSVIEITANWHQPLLLATIILIALLAIVSIMRLTLFYISDKPMRIRKKFSIILQFFVFSLASTLVGNIHLSVHLSLLMIPLSITLAVLLIETRRKWLSNMVIYIFLGLIIAGKVVNFF